jgi:tetratricopeptide (TPR) repeat protein
LVDSVGEAALARGDHESAIEAFRQGHELARRSAGHESLDDPMRAIATFARKLAEALTEAEFFAEAEGLLREAIDFVTGRKQKARVLFALARVAHRRGRASEAFEQMRNAIEIAEHAGADELVAAFEAEATEWFAPS